MGEGFEGRKGREGDQLTSMMHYIIAAVARSRTSDSMKISTVNQESRIPLVYFMDEKLMKR